MSQETPATTPESLLGDLQSIRDLLESEQNPSATADESNEKHEPSLPEAVQTSSTAPQSESPSEPVTAAEPVTGKVTTTSPTLPPGVLPGQRNLFDGGVVELADAEAEEPTPTATASEALSVPEIAHKRTSANPFLSDSQSPSIEQRSPLFTAIKSINRKPNPSPTKHQTEPDKPSAGVSEEDCQDLIDELVAQYLPLIERDLRKQLQKLLAENRDPR